MFKRWYQKEGAGKPAPQSGIAYYGYIIYNNFGPFAGLSLVYLLCCIPIITIPIATIALNRVLIKLIRDRNLFFFHEYWKEFKLSFLKSIPISILLLIFTADAYLMINWGEQNNIMVHRLGYCILFIIVCFSEYAFGLIAIQELKIKYILTNALLLMTLCWKKTLVILIINIIYVSFIVFVFPLSILICAVWLIAFKQYNVCWLLNKVFDTYIFKDKPRNNEQKA